MQLEVIEQKEVRFYEDYLTAVRAAAGRDEAGPATDID